MIKSASYKSISDVISKYSTKDFTFNFDSFAVVFYEIGQFKVDIFNLRLFKIANVTIQ